MLSLPDVTLLAIDCVQPELAWRALRYSRREIDFAQVQLFTSHEIICPDVTVNRIDALTELAAYSRFCLKDLVRYISTDYILMVQADGFVINPGLWDDAFLKYDYIGAPWPAEAPWCTRSRVGNGGFSLRSRRLMELAAALKDDFKHEDVYLTNIRHDYFVSHGCRFAPVDVAMRFSLEAQIPECAYDLDSCFGFHGKGDAFYHNGNGGQFKDCIALLDSISCMDCP